MTEKCTATNTNGNRCGRYPIAGATVCLKHGAAAPHVRAKAAVRAELAHWGLGDTHISPDETLLRLISQSATRAERLATALAQVVAEHGGDLAKAMVGDSYISTADGSTVKVGEYVRGLTALEAQERDRLAGFCAKGIAAGLMKRQVDLAERQSQLVADVMRKVLGDASLGLSAEQRAAVPELLRRHVLAIAA